MLGLGYLIISRWLWSDVGANLPCGVSGLQVYTSRSSQIVMLNKPWHSIHTVSLLGVTVQGKWNGLVCHRLPTLTVDPSGMRTLDSVIWCINFEIVYESLKVPATKYWAM